MLDERTISTVSGWPEGMALLEEPKLSDLGNAQRFIARHGHALRFCHPWQRWLVYDGCRWCTDDTGETVRRAIETVKALAADALELEDDRRKKTLEHALRSENEARIRAMLTLARSLDGVPVLPDELDADPWLLNLSNGTLDLRTLELRDHDPADVITKLAPVAYTKDAVAPRWSAFLERIFGDDGHLIEFVRRAVGYSLTGDTSAQVLFLLHGTGANGKTTLLETLRSLLGDYGQQAPAETLLERRDQIPNDVARLRGARIVAATETPDGRRLNETIIKRMTGGDTMAARFMRAEWFEFKPLFKVWLATNHKPVIRGTDEAIWRRIRLVPFNVTIPAGERDPGLPAALRDELAGILAWAVEGCAAWHSDGLGEPDAVRDATGAYREDQDILGSFIADCCVTATNAKAKAADLYARYGEWAHAAGERDTLTQKTFGQRLADRGFTATRTGAARWWQGIGLLQESDA